MLDLSFLLSFFPSFPPFFFVSFLLRKLSRKVANRLVVVVCYTLSESRIYIAIETESLLGYTM